MRTPGAVRAVCILLPAALGAALSSTAAADTFASVRYEAQMDELVATMMYMGTNPDHAFTVQWGACQAPSQGGQIQEITADVLDSQWDDAAIRSYRKTVRFTLANLSCRPAKLTLRTAPRFLYTILIPQAPGAAH
jgi:hypothetical protein